MKALLISPEQWRYRAMIGVGGIGAGQFFAVHGNSTLSREESRGGRFLDRRDYCKLHIIAHYVGTLLGPSFATLPIGKVGDDAIGRSLLAEMRQAGLDARRVGISRGDQTLFSFCIVYPDGSGGNLTTDDSASAHVDPAFVADVEEDFRRYGGQGVALAVPEVPLDARAALIKLGSVHGFLRVGSFTSSEVPQAIARGLIRELDLIALNRDEAAATIGILPDGTQVAEIVKRSVERLSSENPGIRVSITAGRDGSYNWDGRSIRHVPCLPVPMQSTAGAGDAHLAGIIVSLAAGLEFAEACQFATLLAALSVTSPHTIHPGIDRGALAHLAEQARAPVTDGIRRMLGLPRGH